MRTDKEKAIQLRRAGKSYKAIRAELGIPVGTLAGWFKDIKWSQELKQKLSAEVSLANPKALKLMAQANRVRWDLKKEEYRAAAIKEFSRLKNNQLFLAGLMLYWGEGELKPKSSRVSLVNSDPEMLKIFYLFLTKALKIHPDKIRAWLLLYPDLVDSVQRNFWSKAIGIPKENFNKSIYIKGRHASKRLSFGVGTIVINSRALKERILKWLELYQADLQAHAVSLEK